jgi:ATP-binding cassette subfamily B protein
VFTRIRSLYAGYTVLLISHRYNTIRDADHIYVLDSGGSSNTATTTSS